MVKPLLISARKLPARLYARTMQRNRRPGSQRVALVAGTDGGGTAGAPGMACAGGEGGTGGGVCTSMRQLCMSGMRPAPCVAKPTSVHCSTSSDSPLSALTAHAKPVTPDCASCKDSSLQSHAKWSGEAGSMSESGAFDGCTAAVVVAIRRLTSFGSDTLPIGCGGVASTSTARCHGMSSVRRPRRASPSRPQPLGGLPARSSAITLTVYDASCESVRFWIRAPCSPVEVHGTTRVATRSYGAGGGGGATVWILRVETSASTSNVSRRWRALPHSELLAWRMSEHASRCQRRPGGECKRDGRAASHAAACGSVSMQQPSQ